MEDVEVPTPTQEIPGIDPFKLAAGLARADVRLLLPLWLLLSITVPFQLFIPESTLWSSLGFLAVDRFLQLLVCTLVVARWRIRLESSSARRPSFLPALGRNLAVGFLLWIGITLPALGINPSIDPILALPAAAATAMCMLLALRLFFSFAISVLIGGPLKRMLVQSRILTLRFPASSLRALIGPLAITSLLVAFCFAPFPDGRSPLATVLMAIATNFFWLATSYTGLAFALLMIDDGSWRGSGLDLYRKERLQTIELHAWPSLASIITPSAAWKVIIASVLLSTGALFSYMTEPPTPELTVAEIEVSDKKVRLTLIAHDPEFELRGFYPAAFSLRGASGTPISTSLGRASLDIEGKEEVIQLAPSKDPVTIYLEFDTDRNEEDLKALTDLHLWYNSHMGPMLEVGEEKGTV